MEYTTLLPEVEETQEQGQKQMQSLYGLCQQLVDGRAALRESRHFSIAHQE